MTRAEGERPPNRATQLPQLPLAELLPPENPACSPSDPAFQVHSAPSPASGHIHHHANTGDVKLAQVFLSVTPRTLLPPDATLCQRAWLLGTGHVGRSRCEPQEDSDPQKDNDSKNNEGHFLTTHLSLFYQLDLSAVFLEKKNKTHHHFFRQQSMLLHYYTPAGIRKLPVPSLGMTHHRLPPRSGRL